MQVLLPQKRLRPTPNSITRVPLEFNSEQHDLNEEIPWDKVGVPLFKYSADYYVLLRDLSKAWNFPSSYQLLNRILKRSFVTKFDVLTSTKDLNYWLKKYGLIDSKDTANGLFYIKFSTIYQAIAKKSVFFSTGSEDEVLEEKEAEEIENEDDAPDTNEDLDDLDESIARRDDIDSDKLVTIKQVFPQYGQSDAIQPSHASFNTINNLTKLNFYKTLSGQGYKYLPNNKLSIPERELLGRDSDIYADFSEQVTPKAEDEDGEPKRKRIRKPIGRSKKHTLNVDPNSIDLSESIIPGQGYIHEFSVNHLCKVPNYYTTTTSQQASAVPSTPAAAAGATATPPNTLSIFGGSGTDSPTTNSSTAAATPTARTSFNLKKLNSSSNSSFLFNDTIKMSKNVQQLVFNNDNDNYSHTKYYYTKTYRGPGSGNYKDTSLMNKINKIGISSEPAADAHKSSNQVLKAAFSREKQSLKGLVHDKFTKSQVDSVLQKQNRYTEDYMNMEMLHNNLQFNVLVNTYRSISDDTWKSYYQFKTVDFEQAHALRQEQRELDSRQQYVVDVQEWKRKEQARKDKLLQRYDRKKNKYQRKEQAKLQKAQARMQQERIVEENRRRKQLEATFNDPFENDNFNLLGEDLKVNPEKDDLVSDNDSDDDDDEDDDEGEDLTIPLQPPKPLETPYLDTLRRFTLPVEHPEIVQGLPLDLRSIVGDEQNPPPIKKILRYSSTYADAPNLEYVNKIEIIKIPNSNSFGWDNLRKFKKD